jgi:hypothetical protein
MEAKKTNVLLWRYGKKEPDQPPMVVSYVADELPKIIKLASFGHNDVLYFKLIDITLNGLPVYYETSWGVQP